MTQKVDLHIEELVLHGFSPGDRFRIGEAVELELTRLITEQGIPSSLSRDGEVARTNGGTINVSSNSKADVIGSQVAHYICRTWLYKDRIEFVLFCLKTTSDRPFFIFTFAFHWNTSHQYGNVIHVPLFCADHSAH